MADVSKRRILKEIADFQKEANVNYSAQPMEGNLHEWHFTIRGPPDTDYAGGVYHGHLILPHDYPFNPPYIIFQTDNGRWETGKKICLSNTSHHPESWQPSWNIRTMLQALQAMMPTPGEGAVGAMDASPEERRRLAALSVAAECRVCGPIGHLLRSKADAAATFSASSALPPSLPASPAPTPMLQGHRAVTATPSMTASMGGATPLSTNLSAATSTTAIPPSPLTLGMHVPAPALSSAGGGSSFGGPASSPSSSSSLAGGGGRELQSISLPPPAAAGCNSSPVPSMSSSAMPNYANQGGSPSVVSSASFSSSSAPTKVLSQMNSSSNSSSNALISNALTGSAALHTSIVTKNNSQISSATTTAPLSTLNPPSSLGKGDGVWQPSIQTSSLSISSSEITAISTPSVSPSSLTQSPVSSAAKTPSFPSSSSSSSAVQTSSQGSNVGYSGSPAASLRSVSSFSSNISSSNSSINNNCSRSSKEDDESSNFDAASTTAHASRQQSSATSPLSSQSSTAAAAHVTDSRSGDAAPIEATRRPVLPVARDALLAAAAAEAVVATINAGPHPPSKATLLETFLTVLAYLLALLICLMLMKRGEGTGGGGGGLS